FRSNSFPFVFAYQFLHHFPKIAPIINEVHRVLSNGYFFFDEEPFKRIMRVVLYRQKTKIYSQQTLSKNRYLSLLESFISESESDEEEHGVIENHEIALMEWANALSIFDERDVTLSSIGNTTSKLNHRLRPRNIPNFLLGGLIAGLCRKKLEAPARSPIDINQLLACPDCRIESGDGTVDRPPLVK